MDSTAEEA